MVRRWEEESGWLLGAPRELRVADCAGGHRPGTGRLENSVTATEKHRARAPARNTVTDTRGPRLWVTSRHLPLQVKTAA